MFKKLLIQDGSDIDIEPPICWQNFIDEIEPEFNEMHPDVSEYREDTFIKSKLAPFNARLVPAKVNQHDQTVYVCFIDQLGYTDFMLRYG